MKASVSKLIPSVETYIAYGMKAFDAPGLAIGIVVGDEVVYAKGFGVRSVSGGQPVDTTTVFPIASTTKAFLATLLAIEVDRGEFRWDDRVVDLDQDFQLKDPWVTREFRVYDLLAQRSGLPAYANDTLGYLGFDEDAMMHSLRNVEPTSSFRGVFTYTNITHLFGDRIVADAEGVSGDSLILTVKQTGAELGLDPWDGDIFRVRLLPIGLFAPVAVGRGDKPLGFAQFQLGGEGHLATLRLTMDENGQSYEPVRHGTSVSGSLTNAPPSQ